MIDVWWPAIAMFIGTRATNAKTESANMTIKNIKRAGRGYLSHQYYRCRILSLSTTPPGWRREQPANREAITRKVGDPPYRVAGPRMWTTRPDRLGCVSRLVIVQTPDDKGCSARFLYQ